MPGSSEDDLFDKYHIAESSINCKGVLKILLLQGAE